MTTNLMITRFNAFMSTFFRVAYFSSTNGQITATVINDYRGIFITTTVYGEWAAFGWKHMKDEVADVISQLEYKKCSSETVAIAAVEAAFRKAGIKYVSGIDAWARMTLQFSIISCKWRTLKSNVPRNGMEISKYRGLLLDTWQSANWSPNEITEATLFADCARHVMVIS